MKKIIPLILLALVLAGSAFYFLKFRKNGPSEAGQDGQIAQVGSANTDLSTSCKYDKAICAYFAAQAKIMEKGAIIKTSSTIKNYGVSNSEMKIDGAGNMEIITYNDGKLQSDMIVFENTTYIKNLQDGSWTAFPSSATTASGGDTTNQSPTKSFTEEIKSAYDENRDLQVKKMGTETCGDLTCDKYEMTDSTVSPAKTEVGSGIQTATTSYVWIDTKEHLARKMEFSFEGGTNVMEYQYEGVKVEKPSSIKELPSAGAGVGAGANLDAGKMPSQAELDKMMKDYALDGQ